MSSQVTGTSATGSDGTRRSFEATVGQLGTEWLVDLSQVRVRAEGAAVPGRGQQQRMGRLQAPLAITAHDSAWQLLHWRTSALYPCSWCL